MRYLIGALLGISLGANAALGILYYRDYWELKQSRAAYWSLRSEYDQLLRMDRISRDAALQEQEAKADLDDRLRKLTNRVR